MWVGGWVGGWVGWREGNGAVRMSCGELGVGWVGWVGGWMGGWGLPRRLGGRLAWLLGQRGR